MHRNRKLVIVGEAARSGVNRQWEMDYMHQLLSRCETLDQLSLIYEVIDLNRYKVIRKPGLVKSILLQKDKKRFQFLFNRN
jgi:hypothetical protein